MIDRRRVLALGAALAAGAGRPAVARARGTISGATSNAAAVGSAVVGAGLGATAGAATDAPAGTQEFRFSPSTNPALTVFVHVPASASPATPVVFALHGLLRQGASVRAAWAPLAERGGFIVVVPQFDNVAYKGSANYNLGRVLRGAERTDPATWTFVVIEELFDAIRARQRLDAAHYTLFGHSAGAQFVHRFVWLMPQARCRRAIAANAGWYTMPDPAAPYPWGLAGTGLTAADERRAFARPLTLLLGELDNDPAHDQLSRAPEAMRQGPHRLARGQGFFAAAQARARTLDAEFAWTLRTVPGVGHEFDRMAAAAAGHLGPG